MPYICHIYQLLHVYMENNYVSIYTSYQFKASMCPPEDVQFYWLHIYHFYTSLLRISTQKSASIPNSGYFTRLHKGISIFFIYNIVSKNTLLSSTHTYTLKQPYNPKNNYEY